MLQVLLRRWEREEKRRQEREEDGAERVRVHYQYFREGNRGLGQWRRPGREARVTVKGRDRREMQRRKEMKGRGERLRER